MTTHPDEQHGSTQCDRLLAHLQDHGTINPLEAWQLLGIYRLGARVFDLKERGFDVRTRKTTVSNQWGEKCRVAEYYLHVEERPRAPIATDQQLGLLGGVA